MVKKNLKNFHLTITTSQSHDQQPTPSRSIFQVQYPTFHIWIQLQIKEHN
ncbi:Hypothetical predicted protein [Olea europaea subsp. europaea]|uniref:Uncharacterized protein n=1 Tax=Olea europaea subsp. europaea TaxID=158383 RepID=A0A8S0SKL0_OLEEU|nr:Hypothetical predicted protein [Olea europaea subsp. europaea]